MTLKSTTLWSRTASTSGSAPYAVVASRSSVSKTASTPSYSLPWMPAWTYNGTLTAPSYDAISSRPRSGSVRATLRTCSQLEKSRRCWTVSRALTVTRNMSRPCADLPIDLQRHTTVASGDDVLQGAADRVVRDVREAPGGSLGSVPSGRFSAASASGMPHHGGVSCAPAVPADPSATVSTASPSKDNLSMGLPRKCTSSNG